MRAGRRRVGGILLGSFLATLVAWSPLAVQPALAAGALGVKAATTYTVDPNDGRVHVAIRYTMTSNKPNSATVIYYFREISLGVQADARGVRAADTSGALAVSTRERRFFTEVQVRLRANLYYNRSTTFTVRYDLVGAAPRSESPIRVGRAFVTFGVWAFGDPDQGTVEVKVPAGFSTTVEGDPMTTTTGASGSELSANPTNPDEFFAIVSGERRAEYDERRLSLPGDVEIVVLSWPEDDRWDETVSGTLATGFPELQELVGLDWPVAKDLHVRERYTPALEGYAGLFFTDDQRIDVSEDLDPVTIMHEASHAWFNDDLFSARWIYEGLAEEYAWRALDAAGIEPGPLPERPKVFDPGWQELSRWTFPEVIRDQETNAEERYGYEASFWVVHQIVDAVGVDRMREAFAAADANVTAYPGDGPPLTVARLDDWRRFLDLVEPLEEPDPAAIEQAIRDFVATTVDAQVLAKRANARTTYKALIADAKGWSAPWFVRDRMGSWQFDQALAAIRDAEVVLQLRDDVEAAAAEQGLTLDDDALELAYEEAKAGFAHATSLGKRQLEAVSAIAGASSLVASEPDLFTRVGLIGGPAPSVAYDAARGAFESGDLEAAIAQAGSAAATLAGAPALGQERIILGAIVLAALVAVLLFAVLIRRRRARRPIGVEPGTAAFLAMDATFAPGVPAAAAAAEPLQPSGTLAPDPASPSPPLGEASPDAEGGEPR